MEERNMSEEKNVTLEQDVLVEKEVVNAPAEPVTEAESSLSLIHI